MSSKKILIVCRDFYPENSPRANRAAELAKELSRQSHEVTVLTRQLPAQEQFAKEFGIQFLDLGGPTWLDIPTSVGGRTNWLFRAVRRILWILLCYPDVEFAFRVLRQVPRDKEFDLAISIAAPHAVHWGIAIAKKLGREPARAWVADCGDPFMGQENDSFSPAFYFRWVEKMFCRTASRIAVPTEGAKRGYYQEFHKKLIVIPQGFKFEEYKYLRDRHRRDSKVPQFAFAGLLIPGRRDPSAILDYLTGLQDEFEFHFFTKTPDLVEVYSKKDSRIKIREFLPRMKLMEELASMDFLVNIENVGTKQTPSKLIDYWLCDRPILNIRSYDFSSDEICRFLQGDYTTGLSIGNPEQYRIDNIARKFVELSG